LALKKLAQDWYVSNARHLRELLGNAVVEETGNRETLPVSQIHFRLDAVRRERWNQESLQRERIREIQ
jgi:hypothetical protein